MLRRKLMIYMTLWVENSWDEQFCTNANTRHSSAVVAHFHKKNTKLVFIKNRRLNCILSPPPKKTKPMINSKTISWSRDNINYVCNLRKIGARFWASLFNFLIIISHIFLLINFIASLGKIKKPVKSIAKNRSHWTLY